MNLFRPSTQATGQAAEEQACRFLIDKGMQLVTRNYRCRYGEIDLIMRDGQSLVFVEVRARSNPRYASGAETIDHKKQSKLAATALHYLQCHPRADTLAKRFDVISIDAGDAARRLDWISNAFSVDV